MYCLNHIMCTPTSKEHHCWAVVEIKTSNGRVPRPVRLGLWPVQCVIPGFVLFLLLDSLRLWGCRGLKRTEPARVAQIGKGHGLHVQGLVFPGSITNRRENWILQLDLR